MKQVAPGIYEALLDEYLRDTLARHPELRTVFGKIDPEANYKYAREMARKILKQHKIHDVPTNLQVICEKLGLEYVVNRRWQLRWRTSSGR